MFIKYKAKGLSRVGGTETGVIYFIKLFLSPVSRNSVLEELRVSRLTVLHEEIC